MQRFLIMAEIYLKHRAKYPNGTFAKEYAFYRINNKGEMTSVSLSKRTITKPKSIAIPKGFEVSDKIEFENALNSVLS